MSENSFILFVKKRLILLQIGISTIIASFIVLPGLAEFSEDAKTAWTAGLPFVNTMRHLTQSGKIGFVFNFLYWILLITAGQICFSSHFREKTKTTFAILFFSILPFIFFNFLKVATGDIDISGYPYENYEPSTYFGQAMFNNFVFWTTNTLILLSTIVIIKKSNNRTKPIIYIFLGFLFFFFASNLISRDTEIWDKKVYQQQLPSIIEKRTSIGMPNTIYTKHTCEYPTPPNKIYSIQLCFDGKKLKINNIVFNAFFWFVMSSTGYVLIRSHYQD